jgi:hypothetical protein
MVASNPRLVAATGGHTVISCSYRGPSTVRPGPHNHPNERKKGACWGPRLRDSISYLTLPSASAQMSVNLRRNRYTRGNDDEQRLGRGIRKPTASAVGRLRIEI